jgi:hypothetical protein
VLSEHYHHELKRAFEPVSYQPPPPLKSFTIKNTRPISSTTPTLPSPYSFTLNGFPSTKLKLLKKNLAVLAIFSSLLANICPPHINTFTYGFVSMKALISTCTTYISNIDFSENWKLTKGFRMFLAELYGIHKAVTTIYSLDQIPLELHIF